MARKMKEAHLRRHKSESATLGALARAFKLEYLRRVLIGFDSEAPRLYNWRLLAK